MINPTFDMLNQRGTPMFFSDVFANRPPAAIVGRIFVSTDTFELYRDTGTTWDLLSGPGTGTITGSGTPTKYAIFTATGVIGNSSIEQFTTENLSTKNFSVETSSDDSYLETTLKLTNRYFGSPDIFTFKYGRTILAGSPFLEMRSNSITYPTTRTLFNENLVNFIDQYIQVGNSISNQVGYFAAVEPELTISATGVSNRAILTLSPSIGAFAGTIRTGSALNTLEFQTGIPYVTRLSIGATGVLTISNLAGTGTRMLVASSTGVLSTQATPTIFGSLATGQVAFGSATDTISGSNNLFWDNTNGRLGIGTNTPSQKLDVRDGMVSVQRNTDGSVVNFNIFSGVTPVSAFQISTDQPNLLSIINGRNSYQLVLSTNDTQRARITSSGNFIINNSASDTGQRLQVTGDTLLTASANSVPLTISGYSVTGSGSTNGFTINGTFNTTGNPALIYGNLTNTASGVTSTLFRMDVGGTQTFNINPLGLIKFGIVNGANSGIGPLDSPGTAITANGTALGFFMAGGSQTGWDFHFINYTGTRTATSGTNGSIRTAVTFNPTSGTGAYSIISLLNVINQTGGANGITRGLYIAPTLTSAADWRAIEISSGGVYVNTTSVSASAILQADSTTKGFLPPRMTTTQINNISTPAEGLVVFNTTISHLCCYQSGAWVKFSHSPM